MTGFTTPLLNPDGKEKLCARQILYVNTGTETGIEYFVDIPLREAIKSKFLSWVRNMSVKGKSSLFLSLLYLEVKN